MLTHCFTLKSPIGVYWSRKCDRHVIFHAAENIIYIALSMASNLIVARKPVRKTIQKAITAVK